MMFGSNEMESARIVALEALIISQIAGCKPLEAATEIQRQLVFQLHGLMNDPARLERDKVSVVELSLEIYEKTIEALKNPKPNGNIGGFSFDA